MKKTRLYISLLLAAMLSSCELYWNEMEVPEANEEGTDPTEDLITVQENGAELAYKYTEDAIEINEQYDPYILTTVEDSLIFFRSDTPQGFLPQPGNVLISKVREKYPEGLLRKVTDVKKEAGMYCAVTQQATLKEAFTDLSVDFTNYRYPTVVLNSESVEEENIYRSPAASRAKDVITKGDRTFYHAWNFEMTFNASKDKEFAKYVKGEVTGDITLAFDMYISLDADKVEAIEGDIDMRGYLMGIVTLSGTGSISCNISFEPFKNEIAKAASETSTMIYGVAGPVVIPEIEITIKGGLQLDGTYSKTHVYKINAYAKDFNFSSDSKIEQIHDKYGADESEITGSLQGILDLNVDAGLRIGVGILVGTGEIALFFKETINLNYTQDFVTGGDKLKYERVSGSTVKKIEAEPREKSNISLTLKITSFGVLFKLARPYEIESAFKELEKLGETLFKDLLNGPFSWVAKKIKDIWGMSDDKFDLILEKEGDRWLFGANIIKNEYYIEYLIHKQMIDNGISIPNMKFNWPSFPLIDTSISSFRVDNLKNFDRISDNIMGKIYFEEKGLVDCKNLEVAVFDSDGNFVTCEPCLRSGAILSTNDKNEMVPFSFDFDIPLESLKNPKNNTYKIYPAYVTNSGRTVYDEAFTVKCTRPSITFSNTHHRYFLKELVERANGEKYDNYKYIVRTFASIVSEREVKDWGVSVYVSKAFQYPVTEDVIASGKLYKIGDMLFHPNEKGEREYLKTQGKTMIDIFFSSEKTSLDGYYFYIVPFYMVYGSSEQQVLYNDTELAELADDPTLQTQKYSDEGWYDADQMLSEFW